MTSKQSRLKACPFCGNTSEEEFSIYSETRVLSPDNMYKSLRVSCSCGAMGSDGDSTENAIEEWNKRRGIK